MRMLALLDAEAIGEAVAHDVRHLRRRYAASADRAAGRMWRPRRALPAAPCIAARSRSRASTLIGASQRRVDIDLERVSRKTLSPQCSCTSAAAGVARLQHVVDGRQFLEIERRPAAAMSSASARVGATHIATSSPTWRTLPVASTGCSEILKPGSAGDGADRLDAGEVGGREDRVAIALGHVDRPDPRMRQRAAHERDVLHAGQADVGDVLAARRA